jgi:hypothetical protein
MLYELQQLFNDEQHDWMLFTVTQRELSGAVVTYFKGISLNLSKIT